MGLRPVAVGTLTVLLIGLAGCAPTREVEPSATGAADARAALVDATTRIATDTVTVTQAAGSLHSVTRIDPRTDVADVTIRARVTSGTVTRQITAEIRALGADSYLRLSGIEGIDARRWMRIDRNRLDETVFSVEAEEQFELLTRQFATVRGAAPDFSGTMWIREHADGFAFTFGGPRATTVPFTATVDDQHRLTSITVDPSSLGLGRTEISQTYSGFGAPVTVVAPPAKETVEATDEMLASLGIE